ncbi:DUF6424 family protein [Streptomyces sp. NPDC056683]|uniref:DUF6424 family protein n=1 Tax=Streptomyces sp. NPDC056683 TaxID=3345910 RepID=UPI0036A4F907
MPVRPARGVVDHPKRFESAYFRAARETAHRILAEMDNGDLPYGPRPSGAQHWEMHHGGSLWVKGHNGWRMYRARGGIEWSMQFCAEPSKVNWLRSGGAGVRRVGRPAPKPLRPRWPGPSWCAPAAARARRRGGSARRCTRA